MDNIILQAHFGLFVGRLHPLAVHLPIGFLLLSGLFFWLGRKEPYAFLHKALPFSLFLTAATSIAAALFGWLLAAESFYDEATLLWHRWLGITLALASALAWLWSIGRWGGTPQLLGWNLSVSIVLLLAVGHLGGELTHGKGYLLAHAPSFLQNLFGEENHSTEELGFPSNPDYILIFNHLIQPVLGQKCAGCHNESSREGGLNLASAEGLLEGGDSGPVIMEGKAYDSELFKRVTLKRTSKKFMPPKGNPMSFQEIRLLEYWINDGLSFDLKITDEQLPPDIKALLKNHYGLELKRKAYYEAHTTSPAAAESLRALEQAGFSVDLLSNNNHFIEVSLRDSIDEEKMGLLASVKGQLTWLNLGGTGLDDEMASALSQFPHLTRLRLENNPLTNEGIHHLAALIHLESLNLYRTKVDDEGLRALEGLKNLQTLYLWQTDVTAEGVERLKSKIPGLEADLGVSPFQAKR